MAASALSVPANIPDNQRVSESPPGRAQAGTLSAGQRGVAAGHGGVVAAVWSDTRQGRSNIYAAKSTDGGRSFGPNIRVNDVPGTAGLFGATVALDRENRMCVVWFDSRDGDYDIVFAREREHGGGFAPNVRVNDDKGARATDGGFVRDDFFEAGTDQTGGAFQTLPSIAVDQRGIISVAWQDYRRNQADIYFASSADGGRTFGPNIRVNDDLGRAGQLYPSLAVDARGILSLAWHDFRKGDQDIYFSRSADGGTTWSRNLRVNDDPGTAGQFNPSLAVDADGTVYLAWHDLREGNADVYFAVSRNGGATFTPNMRVNDDQGEAYQFHPSVAVGENGQVAVAWEDYRNGHADIFLAYSTDGGRTFGPNIQVNDDRSGADHLHAGVTIGPEAGAVMIWEDQRHDRQVAESVCRPVRCSDVYTSVMRLPR